MQRARLSVHLSVTPVSAPEPEPEVSEEELAPVPDGTRSAPSASDHPDGMYQDRKEKERHPRLEIVLDQDCLYLRGTGVDVEPARLSGHLVLYLTESTSVREITLHFRGKARLPIPSHES